MRATILPAVAAASLAVLALAAAPPQERESGPATPAPAGAAQRLPELSDATFDRLLAAIGPSDEEEAWRQLPWRTTFWQGVIDAQETDAPVLLFAMNGHPFGCT